MNNRKEELASEPIGKLLFKYSAPAVVGISANSLFNIVDTIFIGQGAARTKCNPSPPPTFDDNSAGL